jgi:hypothetical protein
VPRGRIAFSTSVRIYGTTDPHELAASLGVTYYPGRPS